MRPNFVHLGTHVSPPHLTGGGYLNPIGGESHVMKMYSFHGCSLVGDTEGHNYVIQTDQTADIPKNSKKIAEIFQDFFFDVA